MGYVDRTRLLLQQPARHFSMPKRIILLRHGESLGNVDETAYAEIPDWRIPLTNRGHRQAERVGGELAKLIQGESLYCYCSPYTRTHETWKIMQDSLAESNDVRLLGTREEPRLAEQQFGNFQNPHKVRTAKAERRTFGRFFFRFPNGEAGLDVYNRVSLFLDTLSRDLHQFRDHNVDFSDLNIILVTHGLTLRLFLMRYFQLSVEEFEHSYNPQNAKLVVMDRMRCDADEEQGVKEYFLLNEEAADALNLKGEVSNRMPSFFRGETFDGIA